MSTTYHKDSDYTISEVQFAEGTDVRTGSSQPVRTTSTITRTFNFLSAQLTTRTRAEIYQPRYGDSGASASVATELHIQNFTDLPTLAEVRHMHNKLQELGGNPPPLEEILSDNMGKPRYAPSFSKK